VLEKNGFSVERPDALTCCGMPNLDGGDVGAATRKMEANIAALLSHVRQGRRIVVPGPTCGYTMKKEWPVYVGTTEAREVAAATVDLMEFLDGLRRADQLNVDFKRGLGKIAYHAACHLRAQKIALPGARLLGRLPDTEVRVVERCSAVDGSWGMKATFYEEGAKYGRKLTTALEGADLVVGDCSLAGLRVLKEKGVPMKHPVVALAEAYDLDLS
jgi:glycerol-3-phosphate dehydrogenase subunit C